MTDPSCCKRSAYSDIGPRGVSGCLLPSICKRYSSRQCSVRGSDDSQERLARGAAREYGGAQGCVAVAAPRSEGADETRRDERVRASASVRRRRHGERFWPLRQHIAFSSSVSVSVSASARTTATRIGTLSPLVTCSPPTGAGRILVPALYLYPPPLSACCSCARVCRHLGPTRDKARSSADPA